VGVASDRDGAAFAGGVDEQVEHFGGVMVGGQYADVVDEQVAVADPGDGAGGWPVAARLLRATDDAKHIWQDVARIDPNVTSRDGSWCNFSLLKALLSKLPMRGSSQ
jgi:hypothetical protein